MFPLLGLMALALAALGGLTFHTGQRIDPTAGARVDEDGTGGKVAAWMDDSLRRTGRAVDVLVDKRPDTEVLRVGVPVAERRRLEYVVMGAGLLGLAAVMVVGLALVIAG